MSWETCRIIKYVYHVSIELRLKPFLHVRHKARPKDIWIFDVHFQWRHFGKTEAVRVQFEKVLPSTNVAKGDSVKVMHHVGSRLTLGKRKVYAK